MPKDEGVTIHAVQEKPGTKPAHFQRTNPFQRSATACSFEPAMFIQPEAELQQWWGGVCELTSTKGQASRTTSYATICAMQKCKTKVIANWHRKGHDVYLA